MKFQTPRRKASVQNQLYCSHKQLRHTLTSPGLGCPEIRVYYKCQPRPALPTGLSKDGSLWPVMLPFLHTTQESKLLEGQDLCVVMHLPRTVCDTQVCNKYLLNEEREHQPLGGLFPMTEITPKRRNSLMISPPRLSLKQQACITTPIRQPLVQGT